MSESQIIHYVDQGEFYSVYGISTLICVIMLLWFFVRTNMENSRCERDGFVGVVCKKCKSKCQGKCHCGCHYCAMYEAKLNGLLSVNSRREGMYFEEESVRSHFSELTAPDPQPIQMTEGEIKPYNLKKATYGDVPLAFYDRSDAYYAPEWYDGNKAMYVPNMRTIFQKVNTPIESSFWQD